MTLAGWFKTQKDRVEDTIKDPRDYLQDSSSPGGLPWWLRRQRTCLQCTRPGFDPWVGKIPRKRKWLPTPVFLPGELHGQRNLVDYSPWITKSCAQLSDFHFSSSGLNLKYLFSLSFHQLEIFCRRQISEHQSKEVLVAGVRAIEVNAAQSCPTFCDPMDSTVFILQRAGRMKTTVTEN